MKTERKYQKAVTLAIYGAIIVVLQLLSSFIHFGPFCITLALVPVILVGALYGVGAGALMGFVLSIAIFIFGITGLDGGLTLPMFDRNFAATCLIIFVKTPAAGALAALVYRAVRKANDLVATVLAGIVCPVVNTGVFLGCMALFFFDYTLSLADGQNVITYLFVGMAGVNFLIELGVNMVLAAAITQVIHAVSKRQRNNLH